MLRAAICSFMKLSIFTGDAFAPIFQTKSPVARYNSISSTDCFSFLPFTSLLSYRPRESPDCGSFGNEHFLRRLPFLHSGTLYPFVDASLARRVIVRFCSCLPEPLSASFDIISILCSGSLLRHHTHQYAHRPFGCALFLVWQVSSRILFHSPTHQFQGSFMREPYFPAASIHLHRQYVSRMDITRIASSKVPFLTSFRSRSRFSGGSF